MKTLLIMLLVFGVLGILMVVGVLLLCAWEFYQATERTRRADAETFRQDD